MKLNQEVHVDGDANHFTVFVFTEYKIYIY